MASLTQTKSGKWRVQVEHRGRREYKTFRLKTNARDWATQREAELAKGILVSVDKALRTSFTFVIKEYRENELPKKRNRAYKWILNTLDREFGTTRLADIESKDVAAFRDSRLKAGIAPGSVLKELNLLRVLIDYAKRDLSIYLPENVARSVENPKVNNARDRIFLKGEEEWLLAAMKRPALVAMTQLARETSCRLGELLRTQWQDIDLKSRTARIPNSAVDTPRTIPLSDRAVAILECLPRPKVGGGHFNAQAAADSFEKAWNRAIREASGYCDMVAITQLALETACRLGELLNIEWHEIDLKSRTVHLPETKTGAPRTIPLSSRAVDILEDLKRPKLAGRVFECWAAGDSFEKAWTRAKARARAAYERECADSGTTPNPKMFQNLRFHDLRHNATSRLAKVIPNVIELSRITGHTDLKSLSRYYHVTPEELALRLA